MDSSVGEEGRETQQNTKSSFLRLREAFNIVKRLANLIQLTKAEQEEAGIHIEQQGGE